MILAEEDEEEERKKEKKNSKRTVKESCQHRDFRPFLP